jgi:unsaturated rhamnogalacturonyl hydrolase
MKLGITSGLQYRGIRLVLSGLLAALLCLQSAAQSPNLALRLAGSARDRWPDGQISSSPKPSVWDSELGTLLLGIDASWYNTADVLDYRYIKNATDAFIAGDGSLPAAASHVSPLDQALLGRQLLLLYGVTQEKRYYLAAQSIHDRLLAQIDSTKTTAEQVSTGRDVSDLSSIAPFLAEYASVFHRPRDFAVVIGQLHLLEPAFRKDKHAKAILHPSAASTLSAIVDTLPYYSANAPGRTQILQSLNRAAHNLVQLQDKTTGLWQPVSSPAANCLLTYSLAKAVRLGYLPRTYESNASHTWTGLHTSIGSLDRSGPATLGACLLAATEMENAAAGLDGLGKTVLLDAWYNSQTRIDAAGQTVLFHYKWDDLSNSGFAFFGHIFRNRGVRTETLTTAPTAANLKGTSFYVIVSPDNPAKNPHPHYMNESDAASVASWVHAGGVLVLMENDRDNADIPHLDLLADKFGLHFNNILTHHVIGDRHEMGRIDVTELGGVFTHPHQLFMKDTCSLTLSGNAQPLLTWKGDILMASARFGKGTVVAVADPWIYNEYTDGRNLEPGYDNFAGGVEFVRWLLRQP